MNCWQRSSDVAETIGINSPGSAYLLIQSESICEEVAAGPVGTVPSPLKDKTLDF